MHTSSTFIILIGWAYVLQAQTVDYRQNLHLIMTPEQLKKYFAVDKHEDVPKYEVVNVNLKKRSPSQRGVGAHRIAQRGTSEGFEMSLTSQSVLGQNIQLILRNNPYLISPTLKIVKMEENNKEIIVPTSYRNLESSCHFLGVNGNVSAAVSKCDFNGEPGIRGILLLPMGGINIQPVGDNLTEFLKVSEDHPFLSNESFDFELIQDHPHIVSMPRRSKRLSVVDEWEDERYIPANPREDYELDDSDILSHFDDSNFISDTPDKDSDGKVLKEEVNKRAGSKEMHLELAVFFDQSAYELFMPHVKNENKLIDLILGFVNQMQAVYQQPSLKNNVQISVVHLEMMKKQPKDMPHADGERDKLLDSFCSYQAKKNPASDKDPNHWDLALYISGLNFYSMEKGKKNGVTMGLAPVGGVCLKEHSCVIAEFGTVSEDGKPYPSAGLLSTYVAVHEIGHNLGMYHDGPPNNECPTNGHVMSPSRGTRGETTWSSCSADVLQKINKDCLHDKPKSVSKDWDHSKFNERPGQTWDAHDQCKIFLRDEDASLLNDTVLTTVCEQTLCKTPHRIGYYAAGPALEGTYCGGKNWCQQGKCTSWGSAKPKVVKGGWSKWSNSKCQSGCIEKAKGVQADKRICDNPKPQNTEKLCEGDNIRIHICDDDKLCKNRISPPSFAKERCKEFSKYLPDVTSTGVQVKYNEKRQWQSCAVYCKMKSGTWYTPRQELNDRGVDTFFPEGTWCHNNGKIDYYCQNRLCLPPAPKGRSLPTPESLARGRNPEVDVPLLNNADPKGDHSAPEKLKEFFQYVEGKNPPPLPRPEDLSRPKDEDYWIIDY